MNSVLIKIGNFSVYWYSILLIIAFTIGGLLVIREGKKKNIKKDFLLDYFLYLIPIVLIGARIYYVLFNFSYYQNNLLEIFQAWNGGLAIHGGIIAGVLFTLYYTKKNNVDFLTLTDIMVVSLILGQAIGRWGNFFNQEAYGPAITLKGLQNLHIPDFIIDGMFINGTYYHPTFLYESIWCIVGFLILIIVRRFKHIRTGELTSYYLVFYSFGRLMIEGLRQDSLMLGTFKMAQLISIIMIILGFILFEYSIRKDKKNE